MNIKDVGKKYNISADTIRYWERAGVIPPINRDQNGYRDFDEEDLDWVGHAKCMRDAGVSIEMLADYVQLFKEGDVTIPARKQILEEQQLLIKKKLDEVTLLYERITEKVMHYESHMQHYNGKLKNPKN